MKWTEELILHFTATQF